MYIWCYDNPPRANAPNDKLKKGPVYDTQHNNALHYSECRYAECRCAECRGAESTAGTLVYLTLL
jgi:hypothetical protein